MSNSKNTSGGISFCGLLTVAFIVLKLCKVIDWSWWWVLGPLWIPIAIIIFVGIIAFPFWLINRQRKKYYNDFKKEHKSKWEQRLEQLGKQKTKGREITSGFAVIIGNETGHRFPIGQHVVVMNVANGEAYVKEKSLCQGQWVKVVDLKMEQ